MYENTCCLCYCVICLGLQLSHLKLFLYSFTRKTSGTIDVIGGQTATISRVEGRRRHNLDGNNIQVHKTSHGIN